MSKVFDLEPDEAQDQPKEANPVAFATLEGISDGFDQVQSYDGLDHPVKWNIIPNEIYSKEDWYSFNDASCYGFTF